MRKLLLAALLSGAAFAGALACIPPSSTINPFPFPPNDGPAPLPAGRDLSVPSPNMGYDFRDDAATAPYVVHPPEYALTITGAAQTIPAGALVSGLAVRGVQARTMPWADVKRLHDSDGILFKFINAGTTSLRWSWFDNIHDSISFPGNQVGAKWAVENVYARHIRDDFIENDTCKGGTVDNVLVDNTFVFLSSRPGSSNNCPERATVTVRNSLVRLGAQTYTGDMGGSPAAAGSVGSFWFFKLGPLQGCYVVENTIFVAEGVSVNGPTTHKWPCGTYRNVTFIWRGAGAYPRPNMDPLPAGVTLSTDITAWNTARDKWLLDRGCAANGDSCPFTSK